MEDQDDMIEASRNSEAHSSPLSQSNSLKPNVSVQLKFDSSSQRSTKSKSPPMEMITLTQQRYDEIDKLMKAGNLDKISLAELEEYLTSNMTKSMDLINVELEQHKSQATKDIRNHKNKIKMN